MAKMQMFLRNGPSSIRIEDHEVGVRAYGQRAFSAVESGKMCWSRGYPLREALETQAAAMHPSP